MPAGAVQAFFEKPSFKQARFAPGNRIFSDCGQKNNKFPFISIIVYLQIGFLVV